LQVSRCWRNDSRSGAQRGNIRIGAKNLGTPEQGHGKEQAGFTAIANGLDSFDSVELALAQPMLFEMHRFLDCGSAGAKL
jgi:hypothetical protein